jgi:FtsP/CotA-like multicopper oxidase with cupredoxin domain
MHLPAFLTFLVSTFFHQSDFEPLDIQEPARIDAFSPAPAYVPASAAPAVRHVDLVIQNGDLAPDGYLRSAVLSGDSFPGTLIRGYKGDRFRINVTNLLTDNQTMETSTSIHWHGIHQKHTNWADGSAGVTQCPIPANHSFMYEFGVQHQAGTFW